jgi:hypothetical protein
MRSGCTHTNVLKSLPGPKMHSGGGDDEEEGEVVSRPQELETPTTPETGLVRAVGVAGTRRRYGARQVGRARYTRDLPRHDRLLDEILGLTVGPLHRQTSSSLETKVAAAIDPPGTSVIYVPQVLDHRSQS